MTQRLTEEDWLEHGLVSLSQSGFTALKAEPLAKSLGVSRGSFYWHFKDIKDYHSKLLAFWRSRFTQNIITDVEAENDPLLRLGKLMGLAYQSRNGLESSIRNWSHHNIDVRMLMEEVDGIRLGYVKDILIAGGLSEELAIARSSFIYSAALGAPMMQGDKANVLSEDDIHGLAALMLT